MPYPGPLSTLQTLIYLARPWRLRVLAFPSLPYGTDRPKLNSVCNSWNINGKLIASIKIA